MRAISSPRWWRPAPWTLGLCAVLTALNAGLVLAPAGEQSSWRVALQFDGPAIGAGQWWRLATFALVHWDAQHFLFNLTAFLGLGLLYERAFGRWYPWLLLGAGVGGGLAMLLVAPGGAWRGWSGVLAGLFVAVLGLELARTRHDRAGRPWVALAAALVLLWLCHKWLTLPVAP